MGTKTTLPLGVTPLDDIAIAADNPANQITGDYTGYRKVWLRVTNNSPTAGDEVYLTANGATVASAMVVYGVSSAIFGPFEPEEVNNLGLWCGAGPVACPVKPIVTQQGEIEEISLIGPR